MQKENPSNQKIKLRQFYLKLRELISINRREEAEDLLFHELSKSMHGYVLSFASFGSEINISRLNDLWIKQNRLVLPKIEGPSLELYQIQNFSSDITVGKNGFMEPNSAFCKKIDPELISFALIPGLAFDDNHFRLGYGKGHYDYFLSKFGMYTIGVGFHEQKHSGMLPHEPWDFPLKEVLLT